MSIVRQINRAAADAEAATRAGEFAQLARLFAIAKGDWRWASKLDQASPRVAEIARKAAVDPGSTTSLSSIAQTEGIVQAFLDSLRNVGAFDAMLLSMKRVPIRTRVAAVSLSATGYIVGQGAPKPLTALSLTGDTLTEYVAAAILVLTQELVSSASPDSQALFRRELSNAVAAVTDQQFISLITSGAATVSSAGATANQIHQDFANALNAMSTDAASRLFVLVQSGTAKALATKVTNNGETAFPGMSPTGGTILNMPALVSDGVSNGTMVIADANAIAAAAGDLGLDESTQ